MKLNLTQMRGWQSTLSILFIQLLADIVVVLDIPLARQIIGFILLTFVPGFMFVRLLRLNKLDAAETSLFSLGFSVSMSMFLGLLINMLFPVFGFENPLSILPLMVGMNFLVVGFCLASYLSKGDFRVFAGIQRPSAWTLLFFFLPFLSVVGTLIVNSGGSNFLLLLVIVMICSLVFVYVSFVKNKSSPNLRSSVLLAIAISLLLQHSLITDYIVGNDIYIEFYVFRLTKTASYWNPSAPSPDINIGKTNAMLSVTVLPTIYSQIMNVDGNLIFKFLYPFILSWLVIGLYKLYCTQFDEKTSFLSTLFFTFNSVFFMLFSSRQMVAELFFVLLFLVLLDKKLESSKRRICYLIFGAALVVSHYSMAYIFLFLILFIWLSILPRIRAFFGAHAIPRKIGKTVTTIQVLTLFVLSFCWYMFISTGSPFSSLLNTAGFISQNLYSDFFDPRTRGTQVISALGGGEAYSLWHQIGTMFFYISEFFIICGFIKLVMNRKKGKRLDEGFETSVLLSLFILLMCIVLPNFAGSLQITRFYQIVLLLLAPLFIIGGEAVLSFVTRKHGKSYYPSLLILFLIPFLLFQSGFVYTITGDISWSIPLSIHNGKVPNPALDHMIVSKPEVLAAQRLAQLFTPGCSVYADRVSYGHILSTYGMIPRANTHVLSLNTVPDENSYVYLRRTNIVDGIIQGEYRVWETSNFSSLFDSMNKIYSNGASEIYN